MQQSGSERESSSERDIQVCSAKAYKGDHKKKMKAKKLQQTLTSSSDEGQSDDFASHNTSDHSSGVSALMLKELKWVHDRLDVVEERMDTSREAQTKR